MPTPAKLVILWVVFSLLSGCAAIRTDHLTLNSPGSWAEVGKARWSWLSSGEVVADAGDGFLVSEQRYKNFELRFEFNVDADTNSGVLIHCQDPTDITPLSCFEINIWDQHPQVENRTGAIVLKVPPFVNIDTAGRWSVYRILASDAGFKVYLDDTLVSSWSGPGHTSGHIALQRARGGVARFRNLELKPMAR